MEVRLLILRLTGMVNIIGLEQKSCPNTLLIFGICKYPIYPVI